MLTFQHEVFERTADRLAGAPAVDDHGLSITYGQLETRANQLAHLLRELGCGPSKRVCVFTAKTVAMYEAVLATLKAGGCWVPLSLSFPAERLRRLIELLRPVAVIADETTKVAADDACDRLAHRCEVLVANRSILEGRPTARPSPIGLTGEDLAYVIFTSGSTGEPKGVMARHRSTVQFLSLCPEFFDIAPGSRFAHFSELTFDPSVFDLFHCWQTGGVLVPANRRAYRIDPGRFLSEQRISVLFTVPTALRSVRDSGQLGGTALESVQHLLLTGEPVPVSLVQDWYAAHPAVTIYNMYGTTETCIVSHWCKIPRNLASDAPVPLGKPLPGLRVTLLDGDVPVKTGEAGESCVAGTQISAGYWANPFQTQRAFRPDPTQPDLPICIYRTGDLLREGVDGAHYFVGRTDSQIKLRGHRVELGEVESTLLVNENVFEAAVVLVERPGSGSCLVAFVNATGALSEEALRSDLARLLPAYMIPDRIVTAEVALPKLPSGKLNRVALATQASELLNRA